MTAMIPVNLYVDRMNPVSPVRVADVYAITQNRSAEYREAAAKIGLTVSEYTEFRQQLADGNVDYVVLPRHIDAMAGVHRRNGQVYALRNVLVPSGEMGWRIGLTDGTVVYVPRACANLSLNHGGAIAHKPRAVAARPAAPHRKVAAAPVPEAPADVVTPVSFAPAPAAPVAAPVSAAAPTASVALPVAAATAGGLGAAYFAPIVPFIVGLTHNAVTSVPVAPSCSLGSNTLGVCR
jgi:hypothetical protein